MHIDCNTKFNICKRYRTNLRKDEKNGEKNTMMNEKTL